PADPVLIIGSRLETAHPVTAVQQHTETRIAIRQAVDGTQGERLELGNASRIGAGFLAHALELPAMVHREHSELIPHTSARRGPMQMLQMFVLAQTIRKVRSRQKRAQLGPGGNRRRAAVPRYDQRTTSIRVPAAGLDRLISKPAAQETSHEGI